VGAQRGLDNRKAKNPKEKFQCLATYVRCDYTRQVGGGDLKGK